MPGSSAGSLFRAIERMVEQRGPVPCAMEPGRFVTGCFAPARRGGQPGSAGSTRRFARCSARSRRRRSIRHASARDHGATFPATRRRDCATFHGRPHPVERNAEANAAALGRRLRRRRSTWGCPSGVPSRCLGHRRGDPPGLRAPGRIPGLQAAQSEPPLIREPSARPAESLTAPATRYTVTMAGGSPVLHGISRTLLCRFDPSLA